MTPASGCVVVAGALAQRPRVGGHAWVFLQYLLGFQRLGYDVLLIDRVAGDVPASDQLAWLHEVLDPFGLDDRFSVAQPDGGTAGLSRAEVLARAADSVVLDVMGFLGDDEILGAAATTVFLDIDPGFGQMWRELGLADILGAHDHYLTVGANVGRPGCAVPECGTRWTPTRPPVVLEHWPWVPPQVDAPVTGIASWRGPFGPIHYGGRTYGLRVHEFRKFLELPGLTGERFQLALNIDPAEPDLPRLAASGWELVDPRAVGGDPRRYRSYIGRSKAELMVAKNLYVDTNSGWFSDRSACYLATGRPVIAQDTGWSASVPAAKGLLGFSTPEEAVDAIADVNEDYGGHCRAARALAEEYFDSDLVLTELLAEVGVW